MKPPPLRYTYWRPTVPTDQSSSRPSGLTETRIVRNSCLIHQPSKRFLRDVASGQIEPHSILTVETGHPTTAGFRLSIGSCWQYSTIEDPAGLTGDDLKTLSHALAHEDRLTPEMRSTIEAGIATIHQLPIPSHPVVAWRKVFNGYYVIVPTSDKLFDAIPWSLRLNRQRRNELPMRNQLWTASHWRVAPSQPVELFDSRLDQS